MNNNIGLYTKINLKPIAEEEFYVCILPEETRLGYTYDVWVFRKDYGIAYHAFGVGEKDSATMSVEHIKELDDTGYFDTIKEELYELK